MKNSKTEVLSFDEYWNDQKKNGFIPTFSDVASNAFEAGQQSKQAEVDELNKRVKELELINFDSELHFDAAKEHIDRLQKRIESAMELLEYNEYVDSALQALEILKGGVN